MALSLRAMGPAAGPSAHVTRARLGQPSSVSAFSARGTHPSIRKIPKCRRIEAADEHPVARAAPAGRDPGGSIAGPRTSSTEAPAAPATATSAPPPAPQAASAPAMPSAQQMMGQVLGAVRQHTVIVPPEGGRGRSQQQAEPGAGAGSTEPGQCLLVLLPGVGVSPAAMEPLARAVAQEAGERYSGSSGDHSSSTGGLCLWVAVAGADAGVVAFAQMAADREAAAGVGEGPGLGTSQSAYDLVLREVTALAEAWQPLPPPASQGSSAPSADSNQDSGSTNGHVSTGHGSNGSSTSGNGSSGAGRAVGFRAHRGPSCRLLNVVVAPHSLAGCLAADGALRGAGGLVMLASSFAGAQLNGAAAGGWGGLDRPSLLLAGELDGQLPWPYLVPYAAQSAWNAARMGARHAALNHAVVLARGVNHAATCGCLPAAQASGLNGSKGRGNGAGNGNGNGPAGHGAGPSAQAADRGDCEADGDEGLGGGTVGSTHPLLARLARPLAAFLAVHWGSSGTAGSTGAAEQAEAVLRAEVQGTVDYLAPYAQVAGYGDLRAAWSAGAALDTWAQSCSPSTSDAAPGAAAHNSHPTNKLPAQALPLLPPMVAAPNVGVPFGPGNSTWTGAPAPAPTAGPGQAPAAPRPLPSSSPFAPAGPLSHAVPALHPGALPAAEAEAVEAQAAVLRAAVAAGLLPADALACVRVSAVAHPTLQGLLYAQPRVLPLAGGRAAQVVAHCLPHWPSLDRLAGAPAGPYPASPALWAKLKGPQALAAELCAALGLPPPLPDLAAQQHAQEEGSAPIITAADLNRAAYDWALAAAPAAAVDRYHARGVPLVFGPDEAQRGGSPATWVGGARMRWEVEDGAGAGPVVRVRSLVVLGPPLPALARRGAETGSAHSNGNSSNNCHSSGNGHLCSDAQSSAPGQASPVDVQQVEGVVDGWLEEEEARRFAGGMYVKVMSRAMALEWVMLGGVRQAGQLACARAAEGIGSGSPSHAAHVKCLWGGHAPSEDPAVAQPSVMSAAAMQ